MLKTPRLLLARLRCTLGIMSAREEILNRSIALISLRGYEAVGVQEICDAASVTKPTLYYHFGNKEGLLAAVCADVSAALLSHLHNELTFTGDLVLEVRRLLLGIATFRERQRERYQILVQMLFPPSQSTIRRIGGDDIESVHGAVTRFFIASAGAHGNLRGKEEHLATAFLGQAIAFASLGPGDETTLRDDSPSIVQEAQTFLYGIF